jgi:anti-sigma regulatory factor (Ser/Thr protein kinase)
MERHRPLSPNSTAAGEARSAVRSALEQWQVPGCLDDALLVASELATNAVVHGAAPVVLHLRVTDGDLFVGVEDASEKDLPQVQELTENATAGRGLALVAATSRKWGWQRHNGSKTVWAQIPCAAAPQSGTA